MFIAHLHNVNYATSTIRTFVSAISYIHKIHQLPDPSSSFLITKTLKGLKKLRPAVDIRQPITSTMLCHLLGAIQSLNRTNYELVLFRAMFLVAFYAFCRISEITDTPASHNLLVGDVILHCKPERIIVTFRTFKHSTTRQSVTIYPQQLPYCPFLHLRQYLQLRPNISPHLFVLSNGRPVSRLLFVYILKRAVMLSGFDPKLYTSHSFRIGAATHGSTAASHSTIRSNSFMKYIRW